VGSELAGTTVFVTGAGSGIGRACALAFAASGASVSVADIGAEGGDATVEMIRQAGGCALFVEVDVADDGSVEAAIRTTVEQLGRLDHAVNSAGITATPSERVPTGELAVDVFDRIIAVDLRGIFLSMRYELRHFVDHGGGAIVNIASAAGLVAVRNNAAYVAAKHGVVGLTKSAAIDYATAGIRVNAICPAMVRTAMADDLPAAVRALYLEKQPMGRAAEPEEIADAAVWLCSPTSVYVTGVALPVDGGFIAV
jgi:NAD(P)-dependent dehydrogenase (short-subunit alcohol dehydrogenase family)